MHVASFTESTLYQFIASELWRMHWWLDLMNYWISLLSHVLKVQCVHWCCFHFCLSNITQWGPIHFHCGQSSFLLLHAHAYCVFHKVASLYKPFMCIDFYTVFPSVIWPRIRFVTHSAFSFYQPYIYIYIAVPSLFLWISENFTHTTHHTREI